MGFVGGVGLSEEHVADFLDVTAVDAEAVNEFAGVRDEVFVFFDAVLDVGFLAVVAEPLVDFVAKEDDAGWVVDREEEGGRCGADAFEGCELVDGFDDGEVVVFVGFKCFAADGLDLDFAVGFGLLHESWAEGSMLPRQYVCQKCPVIRMMRQKRVVI